MRIFSLRYLPRDLIIIGIITIVLDLFLFFQINGAKISIFKIFISIIAILVIGSTYFALSFGVSRREKWAWSCGILFFVLLIVEGLTVIFLGEVSVMYGIISLLIPFLFLFTFINYRKEICVNPPSSFFPLVVTIIGTLLTAVSIGWLIYHHSFTQEKAPRIEIKEGEIDTVKKLTSQWLLESSSIKLATIPEGYEVKSFKFNSRALKLLLVITKDTEEYIFINGQKSEDYRKVERCIIDNTGLHFACAAMKKEKEWYIVSDGFLQEGPYKEIIRGPFFSPNGEHLVYTIRNDKEETFLVFDRKQIGPYGKVFYFQFSPNSKRFAYVAQNKGSFNQFVVVDGEKQKEYDRIDVFMFSPTSQRFAYEAYFKGESFVVLDGKEQEKYESVDLSGSSFSSDDAHFAYIATRDNKQFLVIDGKEEQAYEYVSNFSFSPNGNHYVYEATKLEEGGISKVIVLDGKEITGPGWAENPFFSPDSKRLGYLVRSQDTTKFSFEQKIIIDGKTQKYSGRVEQIKLSPDGQHFVYIVWNKEKKEYIVVLDDTKETIFRHPIESFSPIVFSPDSSHFAYFVYPWKSSHDKESPSIYLVIDNKKIIEISSALGSVGRLNFSANSQYLEWLLITDDEFWWVKYPITGNI
ncbi:MAG: PD40 domain-containing protein [Candidatus Aenigmarchaeota archaeon]|nr:PD40 domain-containing protein [Candidatus Aenigmarchaeota archaeon]